MTDQDTTLIEITASNYQIYREIINASIQNYYERSFYYHDYIYLDSYRDFLIYLSVDASYLVQKNNKIIGFFSYFENVEDSIYNFCVFLHPRACKMGVLTLMDAASDTIIGIDQEEAKIAYISHHSMLLTKIKNRFKVYTINRLTDTFMLFTASLNKDNKIKDSDAA